VKKGVSRYDGAMGETRKTAKELIKFMIGIKLLVNLNKVTIERKKIPSNIL
jgi:hypothetical protein